MSEASGSSWETTSHNADPLRKSLVERARKRRVVAKQDPHWWVVTGHVSLGDSFGSYDVHLRDDNTLYCSCSTNRGGEYRKKVCSHRTAVILWRQEHDDPWDDNDDDELEEVEGAEGTPAWGSAETASAPSTKNSRPKLHLVPVQVSGGVGTSVDSPIPMVNAEEPANVTPPEPSAEGAGPTPPLDAPSAPSVDDDAFDPFELDWDEPPAPQIVSWSDEDEELPDKFTRFRPDQWRGIIEVIEALDEGVKAVFLSAPTGTGKSLVAATVPQILGQPFIYTCTTHVLQHQIETEFYYADVLKGRRNYPTFDDPELTADDCTRERTHLPACPDCPGWSSGSSWGSSDDESDESRDGDHCRYCHPTKMCPYNVAKNNAIHSRMAVLNTRYFLTETNMVYQSNFAGWDLVFIDEADMLENELMDFITVEITAKMRKDLGVGLPAKKTVEESWVEWVRDEVVPAVKGRLKDLPSKAADLFGKPDPQILRARKRYKRLLEQLNVLLKPAPYPPGEEPDPDDDTPALMSGWVMTGYEGVSGDEKQEQNISVIFKPITVRDYAPRYLWNKAKQFVLMSATIISPEQMAYDLGLQDDEWAVVEIPSSFPKERRPVIIRAEASVTQKTEREAYPILIRQLGEIMEEHPDERILVHSNSYKLTRELFFEGRKKSTEARQRLYTYLYAHERDKALANYLNDPRGVLIAPSFQRGVDLHGEDCRVIVIAKVPYPYLGDKQISARLYGTGKAGRIWYAVDTIRTIVQMTGRGMRSKEDWAISYILDKQFLRIFWDNRNLFPNWWREAVVMDENDPKWKEALEELKG